MVADDIVAALRRRIAEIEDRALRLETPQTAAGDVEVLASSPASSPADVETALPLWRLGLGAVDDCLPNGALAIAGLHEVTADYAHMPAAGGFCVALVVRLLGALRHSGRRMVLWCVRGGDSRAFGMPYGPGLADLGLEPGHLIFVHAEKTQDLLWAMEEGLKTPALAGVVGEVGAAGLATSRRLLLAARESGVPGLIVRANADHRPSAAMSQWRLESLPSAPDPFDARAPGEARWRVTLHRTRGGGSLREEKWPRTWNLEWNRETHRFRLAAVLADRSSHGHEHGHGSGEPEQPVGPTGETKRRA